MWAPARYVSSYLLRACRATSPSRGIQQTLISCQQANDDELQSYHEHPAKCGE